MTADLTFGTAGLERIRASAEGLTAAHTLVAIKADQVQRVHLPETASSADALDRLRATVTTPPTARSGALILGAGWWNSKVS